MSNKKLPGRIVGPHSYAQEGPFFGLKYFVGIQPEPQGKLANRIEVEPVVLDAMAGRWAPSHSVHFFDDGYYLPTVDEVRQILAISRVSRMDYAEELFDCEDFAFGVRGEFSLYGYEHADIRLPFALGIVMGAFTGRGGNHAMCFFVDDAHHVHLVEPRQPVQKAGAKKALAPAKIKLARPDIGQGCYLLML